MIRRAAPLSILAVCAVTGCRDWDALSAEYDAGGKHEDAAVSADAALDAHAALDATSELDTGLVDAGPLPDAGNGCPNGQGPQMVRVTMAPPTDGAPPIDFCIDATEVTRGDYAEFLSSVGGDTSGQPPECQWNTSYLAPVSGDPELPVVHVDFCDARAYCSWAGKRLCSGIDTTTGWNVTSPLESEWLFACTQGGNRERPYGNVSQAGACAFLDNAASGPVPTGSLPLCEGGFPGTFDMIGNVWEWIDRCSAVDGGGMNCAFEGGSYKQIHENYRCATMFVLPIEFTAPDIGIRCCASVQ